MRIGTLSRVLGAATWGVAGFALTTSLWGCAEPSRGAAPEAESAAIFNGEDLSGWDGDPRFWSVQNGVIVGETTVDNPTERNTFLFWEGGEPSDFEVSFDYRLMIVSEDRYGNSGLQIRSERFTDPDKPNLIWRARGYQPDFAISDWIPGIMHGEGGLGPRVNRGQRVRLDANGERHEEQFADGDQLGEHVNVHSEWNTYRIYARGDTIRSWINDQLMHELIDESPEARHSGVLAFQVHSGRPMRVEIRNVHLTEF